MTVAISATPVRGASSIQVAYDASGVAPHIVMNAANGPLTLRDNATPIGDIFVVERNDGVDLFNIDPTQLNFGLNGNRGFELNLDETGRDGMRFLPDGRTVTTVPTQTYMMQWDSLVVSDIPGGAPFGNDTAPAMIGAIGEARYDDPGNLFSSALLFNQATIMTANGFNVGPAYTMVNQPQVRTGALGGSRTFSQANAVRSQMRVGPNIAGNVTLTSHEPFFATMTVDATVGTATATTVNYFAAKAPNLVAGGTVGTLNCFDLPNIPAAGITNLRGINSAMNAGSFINHTGTATADFGGNIRIRADIFSLVLGASQDFSQGWAGADFMFWQFNASGNQMQWSNPSANRFLLNDNTGAGEFNFNCARFSLGGQTGAVGNQVGVFVAPARTVTVPGGWSDFLLTQGGNLDIDGNGMSQVFGWTINAPSIVDGAGGGSITDAGGLLIGGNVSLGTNRYGLYILSNPSGGTLNYSLRTAGAIRSDGDFEHLGTNLGFHGSTPLAQQNITGSRGGNAALANLLTALAALGLITDGTSA